MTRLTLRHSHLLLYHISRRNVFFILLIFSVVIYSMLIVKKPDCSELCSYQTYLTADRLIFNNSDYLEHSSEFVCSQNFRNLADWVYGWPDGIYDEKIESSINGRHLAPCLPSKSIIHVKTDYLTKFFRLIYPYLTNEFVLITSQGDTSAPSDFLSYLNEKDSKIIHWFAQNPDMELSENDRFTPLPIGINCYEMANGIRQIYREYSHEILPSNFVRKDESSFLNKTNRTRREHLLLLNFNPETDSSGFRFQMWKVFCESHLRSSFVICIEKASGVEISDLPRIYKRNRQYPFWLSPHGNGLDCYRTWEALYLNVIPIVWNSTLNPLFLHLPVLIINDWKELTEEYLQEKLNEITTQKRRNPSVYRWEKLTLTYWRQMILSKSRHSITSSKRDNLCWHGKSLINAI